MFRVPFNPLVERLVGFNMERILAESLRFGVIVGVVMAVISAPILPGWAFGLLAMYLAIPLLILTPPVMAAFAARFTARDIVVEKTADEAKMSEVDVVQSYFMMAIYRLRWLVGSTIAVCGGLLGGLVSQLAMASASSCMDSNSSIPDCVPVPPFDVMSSSLTVGLGLAITAGALSMILMAAALGVMLALWRRRVTEVSIISTVIVLMIESQAFVLYLVAVGTIMSGEIAFGLLIPAILMAVLPLAIAWGLLRLAPRWV